MRRPLLVSIILLTASTAGAVPGPDSVAVVANSNVPGSVALAERYQSVRDVPPRQVCLLDLPVGHTIDQADFESRLVGPLEECLGDVADRIDTIVLMRGVPQRVTTTSGRASLAAMLQVIGSTTNGGRLIDEAPGNRIDCGGTPCTSAQWRNPYTEGPIEPMWARTFAGVDYRLRLVTAIDGRSDADAARLIASATTAEAIGGATEEFLFMDGADNARGVLDSQYDRVITALTNRGHIANRVPFSRDETGHDLASFFVGTARLDTSIEGNTFLPGSIVDNLTSFGAVPENFEPANERQVSIARWVAKGVAGVHGTTDEPLNNCFPNRNLLVDYVDGYTLSEAFAMNMPFVYWRNLVLGDPMAAPYATRPQVSFENITDGERIVGARRLGVLASDPDGRPLRLLKLYVDGELVEEVDELAIVRCQTWTSTGSKHLLAVAQVGPEPGTKGWSAIRVEVADGPTDCNQRPDAGVIDAGVPRPDAGMARADAGAFDSGLDPDLEEEGCSCRAAPARRSNYAWCIVLLLVIRRSKTLAPRAES